MTMGNNLKSFYIVLISFNFFYVVLSDDKCEAKGPCSCVFVNGTGFDLSPSGSAGPSFLTAHQYSDTKNGSQYLMSTYYFHPCNDVKPALPSENSSCTVPLSICRRNDYMNKDDKSNKFDMVIGHYEYMGTNKQAAFSENGSYILFTNGPSDTRVFLVCAETDDRLEIASLDEPNDIHLAFYSRNACLKQIEELGRSLGSTLLIIFFSLLIFYLVLGICTKKFLMGATGVEVIPNLTFWTDLPNLVKDGWAFAWNGFKLPTRGQAPATSPDPNSYDSI